MSTVSFALDKGVTFDLSKSSPNLTKLRLGLGWDAQSKVTEPSFDLDALVITLYDNKKLKSTNDVIFYGNSALKQKDGSIVSVDNSIIHHGDNLTGSGDGDDEVITIDLTRLNPDINYVLFAVTIYDANNRNQTFGQVSNSYIALYDEVSNIQLCHYNLKDSYMYDQGVIFGVLERDNNTWSFSAVGEGFQGTLNTLLEKFS